MERFNRRHILFAVVGAAGLALAVDKFLLGGGVTSPSAASASIVDRPGQSSDGVTVKAAQREKEARPSPAGTLAKYRKSKDDALGARKPQDAMAYPGWAMSGEESNSAAAAKASESSLSNVFSISGIANNSVRLKRHGDKEDMKHGRLLRIGEQIAWSPDVAVAVKLVSIAPDNKSAIIDVDGERRELPLQAREGDKSNSGSLSPRSTVHVEKASEQP